MRAKHDTTGGRSFFEVPNRLFPRAFHANAWSHCAIAVQGGLVGGWLEAFNSVGQKTDIFLKMGNTETLL